MIVKYSHQHSGSEVKFIKELGDKDVILHKTLLISFFSFLDDLSKPLPLLLSTSHPDEEHLYNSMAKKDEYNF